MKEFFEKIFVSPPGAPVEKIDKDNSESPGFPVELMSYIYIQFLPSTELYTFWRLCRAAQSMNVWLLKEQSFLSPTKNLKKTGLWSQGIYAYFDNEFKKYPDYIQRPTYEFLHNILDSGCRFFKRGRPIPEYQFTDLVFDNKFSLAQIIPPIEADDAQNLFPLIFRVNRLIPIFMFSDRPYFEIKKYLQHQNILMDINEYNFVCFLPMLIHLNRPQIFDALSKAYLLLYPCFCNEIRETFPHLFFKVIFNLVIKEDKEALFIQKMIANVLLCCYSDGRDNELMKFNENIILEMLELAKEHNLLTLVQKELSAYTGIELVRLKKIVSRKAPQLVDELFVEESTQKMFLIH